MSARRSDALICRTSWLKNRALLSAAQSSRAASRSRAPGRPRHPGRPRGQRRGSPAPAAASSRRKSGSGELRNAATGLPPSTAPAAPPGRSSPSAPRRSCVSSSSSSAPSSTTERRPPQLRPWSQIRGPLQYIEPGSYEIYRKTGVFPDGTIFFKELQLTLRPAENPDGSRTEPSGRGYFPGAFNGADVTVKDTKRFADRGAGDTSISIILNQRL